MLNQRVEIEASLHTYMRNIQRGIKYVDFSLNEDDFGFTSVLFLV